VCSTRSAAAIEIDPEGDRLVAAPSGPWRPSIPIDLGAPMVPMDPEGWRGWYPLGLFAPKQVCDSRAVAEAWTGPNDPTYSRRLTGAFWRLAATYPRGREDRVSDSLGVPGGPTAESSHAFSGLAGNHTAGRRKTRPPTPHARFEASPDRPSPASRSADS
jgi:hypothetical protein